MISGNWLFKILLSGSVLLATETSLANNGKPMLVSILKKDIANVTSICDSLPPNKTVPENKQTTIIKEVPKAKKQTVPISVPAVKTIKPIKVIKPKIIKPTIKIN